MYNVIDISVQFGGAISRENAFFSLFVPAVYPSVRAHRLVHPFEHIATDVFFAQQKTTSVVVHVVSVTVPGNICVLKSRVQGTEFRHPFDRIVRHCSSSCSSYYVSTRFRFRLIVE